MRKLPTVLMTLAAVVLAGCSSPGGDEPPRTEVVEIQIDEVIPHILKSKPAKVELEVKGVVGDSCNKLDQIAQTRAGNDITVKITAIRTLGVACMELAQMFNQTIPLEGDFPSGAYTVTVNRMTKTLRID